MGKTTNISSHSQAGSHASPEKIRGLDGLRAIAFLLVFGLHTGYIRFGWMGVQLFFVISGFLITDILLRMKETLTPGEYFLKFYARRFLRIFPLYYFFLFSLAGLAMWLTSLHYKPNVMRLLLDQLKFAFLYLFNFFSATNGYSDLGILDHIWSLSVEEQFYIGWPLMVLLIPRKIFKKFIITGMFLGFIFRVVIFFVVKAEVIPILRTSAPLVVYFMTFSHIDAFSFGAYISRFPLRRARLIFALMCFTIPAVGVATHYLFSGSFVSVPALGFDFLMPISYQFLWAYSLLNIWFMYLVYIVAFENAFTSILELPPLRYLGRISYGLYVFHFPVIWFVEQAGSDFGFLSGAGKSGVMLVSLVFTILLAVLSFHFLEAPFLKLKDRFSYTS